VRVPEIAGLDYQVDGGTLVKYTGEIGAVKVVDYKSEGRIYIPIYIKLE